MRPARTGGGTTHSRTLCGTDVFVQGAMTRMLRAPPCHAYGQLHPRPMDRDSEPALSVETERLSQSLAACLRESPRGTEPTFRAPRASRRDTHAGCSAGAFAGHLRDEVLRHPCVRHQRRRGPAQIVRDEFEAVALAKPLYGLLDLFNRALPRARRKHLLARLPRGLVLLGSIQRVDLDALFFVAFCQITQELDDRAAQRHLVGQPVLRFPRGNRPDDRLELDGSTTPSAVRSKSAG